MISITVPTYREAENIPHLVTRISDCLNEHAITYEIIIVDDNSQDGTEDAVASLASEGLPVRLITRMEERGLSSAVVRGFEEAQNDVLLCMDADLSHPPETIPQMLNAITVDGADFVIGSRYVSGGSTDDDWGLFRWLNSKVATLLARPFTKTKDPMAGFFAIPKKLFDSATNVDPIGYKIGLELLVKCNCQNIKEIPIHFSDRQHGQSKMNMKEQFKYLTHIKRLFDHKYGTLSKFGQFCLVGASGAVIDLSSYAALLKLGLIVHLARAIAIAIAMSWNFFLNKHITFGYGKKKGVLGQYLRFVGASTLGAVVNWSISTIVWQSVFGFEGYLLVGAILGILAGTVSNFICSSLFVFPQEKIENNKQTS